jgi:hypothetical protein
MKEAKLFSGKTSQKNKILVDSSTRLFPDCAGKRRFSCREQLRLSGRISKLRYQQEAIRVEPTF